jgi:hypothetical protein
MANHRQKIEDQAVFLGRATHTVITALGIACAVWLLLGFREITPTAWFFIVLAALVAVVISLWGGRRLRERIIGYESHEGLTISSEFTDQMRIFSRGHVTWPTDDADQDNRADIPTVTGWEPVAAPHLLCATELV